MTDTLRNLLREDADHVEIPTLDANEVIGRAERRLRRRRATTALGAVAAVAVIAAGGLLASDVQHESHGPVDGPADTGNDQRPAHGVTRRIVWSDDLTSLTPGGDTPRTLVGTLHVGDQEVKIDQVLHSVQDWAMFVTDDGAVYVQDDHSIWFTDGGVPQRIASDSCAVSAGGRSGLGLATGEAGALVAWFDCTPGARGDLVVYDTGAGREVARHGISSCRATIVPLSLPWTPSVCTPDAIVGQHVYFGHFGADGVLAAHEFRFDVTSGQVERAGEDVYVDDLRSQGRALVLGDTRRAGTLRSGPGTDFRVVGSGLVPVDAGGWSSDDDTLTRAFEADGNPVQLRLPAGYQPESTDVGTYFTLFEWLDDDTVALAQGGSSTVGDIIVCHLSGGDCRLAPGGPSDGGAVVPGLPLPG